MRGVLDPVPNKSQCGSWIVRLEYLGHCAGRERLEQNSAAARQSFAFPITGIRGWSQMFKKKPPYETFAWGRVSSKITEFFLIFSL